MTKNKLFQNRFVMLAFYVISLLPLWLPWFGFDPEVDGLRSGIETINPIILVILVIAMMGCIFIVPAQHRRMASIIVLLLHDIVYVGYFLFWHVPLVTDFDIITSFETAHFGFYLAIILNVLAILGAKGDVKEFEVNRTHARASN